MKFTMFSYNIWLLVAFAALVASNSEFQSPMDEADVDNAMMDEIATFAVTNHPGNPIEEDYHDALERLVSVEEEEVDGDIIYTLALIIGSSNCALKAEFDRRRCKVKASSESRQCVAQVNVKFWMQPEDAVIYWQCE